MVRSPSGPEEGGGPRIKIGHVITDSGIGGAEMMLYRLLAHRTRRFEHFVVSLTDKGEIGAKIEALGIKLTALHTPSGSPGPLAFCKLVRILRAERPAVLQTWLYHADLFGLLAAKVVRVPKVLWNLRCSCVDTIRYPWTKRTALAVLKRLSGSPQAVIVNSQAGLDAHRRIGYRPRRWAVINNGFDLAAFCPRFSEKRRLKEKYYANGDLFVIGLVARWDPLKDHENFLKAARILLDKYGAPGPLKFVLVGSDIADNPSLTRLIKMHGVEERVIVLKESADVADIMPSFDVCTSSSCSEGFPNTIGEAMACGVPCVTTDAGDSAYVVGKTGVIVPIRDPEALAAGWQEMLSMGEEERYRRGMRARERIESNFSIDRITAQYESLYADVLEGGSGR